MTSEDKLPVGRRQTIIVHLFSNSKVMERWIFDSHRHLEAQGWKHISQKLFRNGAGDQYRLVVASRKSVDEVRGITIDKLEVEGPWTDDLIRLHDAAMLNVRPEEKP